MPVVYIIIIYVLNSVATLVETPEILIEWQENWKTLDMVKC